MFVKERQFCCIAIMLVMRQKKKLPNIKPPSITINKTKKMIHINYEQNTIFETTEDVLFQVVEENVLHRSGKTITGNFENITNVLIQHCPKDNETDFSICYDIAFAAVLVSVNMNVKLKIKKHGDKRE